jgi:hypothetical protein
MELRRAHGRSHDPLVTATRTGENKRTDIVRKPTRAKDHTQLDGFDPNQYMFTVTVAQGLR